MDEMKIKLSSGLMKGLVSKILSKIIFKQTGYHIDIQLNEMVIKMDGDKANIHADLDGTMDKEEVVLLTKSLYF